MQQPGFDSLIDLRFFFPFLEGREQVNTKKMLSFLLILVVGYAWCLPSSNNTILFDGRFSQYKSLKGLKQTEPGQNGYMLHIFQMRVNDQDGFKYLSYVNASDSANDAAAIKMTLDNDAVFGPNDKNQKDKLIRSDLVQKFNETTQALPTSGILAYFVSVKSPNGFKSDRVFQIIFQESDLFKLQVEKTNGSMEMQFNVEKTTVFKSPFKPSKFYNYCILLDLDKKTIDLVKSTGKSALKKTMKKPVSIEGKMDFTEFHIGALIYDETKASVDAKETLIYAGTQIVNFGTGATLDDFNSGG